MKPDKWLLVRGARQLLTLHHLRGPRRAGDLESLGMIPDGSVLLRNGVIEAVGPTRRIENMADARDADEINAAGRVVMPAFVDCQACVVPVPSYRCAAAKTIQALPAGRLEAQAEDLLKTMARHGTASVGALSGYGGDSTGELKILRALHGLDNRPLDVVSILFVIKEWTEDRDGLHELLEVVARRKLAAAVQVRCGTGGVSLAETEGLLEAARRQGFARRVEMLPEHEPGLVGAAVDAGAVAISAMGPFSKLEIELLSFADTFAILLPAIEGASGAGDRVRQLVDDGGLIALGGGMSPETGGTASMQSAVQLACERFGLTVEEAISAATINAAWALGLGGRSGSLEHGKQGDLILLNAADYREVPLLAGTNLTYMMMKRGVVVFKEEFEGWPARE